MATEAKRATVAIKITCPRAEVPYLVRILRRWDGGLTDRHMDILIDEAGASVEEVLAFMKRLEPKLPELSVMNREDARRVLELVQIWNDQEGMAAEHLDELMTMADRLARGVLAITMLAKGGAAG